MNENKQLTRSRETPTASIRHRMTRRLNMDTFKQGMIRHFYVMGLKTNRAIPSLFKYLLTMILFSPLSIYAQSAGGSTGFAALQQGLQVAMGMVMCVAFFKSIVAIINGGMSIYRGDTSEGKMSLIAGVVIAGSVIIIGALFENLNGGKGLLIPSF
jgi:hypothetical protein